MLSFFAIIVITVTALSFHPTVAFVRSSASTFQQHSQSSSLFVTTSSSIHDDDDDARRLDSAPTARLRETNASTSNSPPSALLSRGEGRCSPPYLAVLTEPDACASVERVEETIRALERATADGGVDLVVVRVASAVGPRDESADLLKLALLKSLAEMKRGGGFSLVVNDDEEIVLRALSQNITVDGVHVKEHKAHLIPSIRSELERAVACSSSNGSRSFGNVIIGTSCHSLRSAMRSYRLPPRGPDYLFVGTCYLTESHPEKQSADQLEGPGLPGRIRRELHRMYDDEDGASVDAETISQSAIALSPPPFVFAIGGIDEQNCHEPVGRFGADGVATIRTVMQSSDPREVVQHMKSIMQKQKDRVDE